MANTRKQANGELLFFLIGAAAALLCFAVTCVVLCVSDTRSALPVLLGAAALIVSEGVTAYFFSRRKIGENIEKEATTQRLMTEVLRNLDCPVVITEVDGNIIWSNAAMEEILSGSGSASLEQITGVPMAEIMRAEAPDGCRVILGERIYSALSYIMPAANKDFWMTFFTDRTDLALAEARVDAEAPVIVYAVLDNIDRVSQLVRSSYREESNRIEILLTEWAKSLDGFVREYDRDKYMIAFPRNRLAACEQDGFAVLDEIRRKAADESRVAITVSMGISECGDTVREREADAAAALETALQRGGDQVVLHNRSGSFAYFGGMTKSDISRTRIGTRTAGIRLVELIRSAGNVLIMGHSTPDFDSIGGCVGLCRLAGSFHPEVRIVIDRSNPNFLVSTAALLRDQPEYDRIFISGEEGMEMLRSDTLLIVADTNNLRIVECPELAANAATQVIIDHHRKAADFTVTPALSVIEPGTSSCSELVSEMLEFAAAANMDRAEALAPTPAEADLMLAGIMLDTKNFTRTTGEETFAAAMFLRAHGANSETVRTFFFNGENAFILEARLSANLKRFRERIAITAEKTASENGQITSEDRIMASKVAESLLAVNGIDASFVMFYSDTAVLISGRSNGNINVQLILEKLGGGGRYDAAGAQIAGKSFQMVSELLKESIDNYLDGTEGKK